VTDGYPLAAVLALRERDEAAAQAVLAEALAAEERARRSRDRLRAALEGAAAAPRATRDARDLQPSAGALAATAGWTARVRRDERAAEEALAAAVGAVAAARTSLAGASAARQAIARHREAWEKGRLSARERAEDAALDDLASARARDGAG
jgi:flagellar export protein FliJ